MSKRSLRVCCLRKNLCDEREFSNNLEKQDMENCNDFFFFYKEPFQLIFS